jgi:DNA-binding HxlR family transcriptional regulator
VTKKNLFRRSSCPISYVLDILGDKWTLLVIRDLAFARKRYFRDFLASSEKIASNILADRLKTLAASGIVSRRPDPANARNIIYELTEKGEDLIPALLELGHWGAKHDAETGAPMHYIRRIEKDREGLIAEIKSLLKAERTRET